jgi:hypothetical protein
MTSNRLIVRANFLVLAEHGSTALNICHRRSQRHNIGELEL